MVSIDTITMISTPKGASFAPNLLQNTLPFFTVRTTQKNNPCEILAKSGEIYPLNFEVKDRVKISNT